MEIDVTALRDFVGDYDLQLCTEGNMDIAEKCIERGKLFVKSLYKKANRTLEYDENDEYCKEAIMLAASSELYVRGKRFDDANQKRKQCQAMIINEIGAAGHVYKDDELVENKIRTVVVTKRGTSSKINFNNY